MAERANLAIKENGQVTNFPNSYGAYSVAKTLGRGPKTAMASIREGEPTAEWFDEVWCEGAALVDVDDHVVLFYESGDLGFDACQRREALERVGRAWPGYNVHWAYEGMFTIADHLGISREKFRVDDQGDETEGDPVFTPTQDAGYCLLMTTVRDGQTRVWKAEGGNLAAGPACITTIPQDDDPAAVKWTYESGSLVGGVHVDFDGRRLAFWGFGSEKRRAAIAEAWPGWDVKWLRDRWELHLAMVETPIVLPKTYFCY